MEYLVEFNSFIKKIKAALKDREEVKINTDEVCDEIKNILSFVDDEPNIDVKIDTYKSSSYGNAKSNDRKGAEMIYMHDEKDFIVIMIKDSSSDSNYQNDNLSSDKFNIDIVKNDILSMIDYISNKYNPFKLSILVREPRKKVRMDTHGYDGWVKKVSKGYEVGLKTFEDLDGYFDAVKISIIL